MALVAFRIKQFIERMGAISMQRFYPDAKWRNKLFPPAANAPRLAEKSVKSYLMVGDYKVEVDHRKLGRKEKGLSYIRINYAGNSSGFLIEIGDKIRFAGNDIYLIQNRHSSSLDKNPTPHKMLYVWKKADAEIATDYSVEQDMYNKQYWADYEREQIDEMINETHEAFDEPAAEYFE